MASGTITLAATGTFNGGLYGQIKWESTSNGSTANTSTVTAAIQLRRDSGWATTGTWKGSLVIGGKTKSISYYGTIGSDWVTVDTLTTTIAHNDDGSGACRVYGKVNGPTETSLEGIYVSGEKTVALDTIPRASTITSAAAVTLGNSCKVIWTPNAASFRFKLKFTLGSWSYTTGTIYPGSTSAYTYTGYTIPLTVANQIASAKTGTMTVTLYTYSDSGATTLVGSAVSKTFTVTVPNSSSTKPSVSMTLAPVSSLAAAFDGLYIQGKTKVKATPTASGKYGASIESISMSVEGKSYGSGADYTSGYLTQYGSAEVTVTATDSRGITGSAKQTITVIAYSKPQIQATAVRCDADGGLSDEGTYLLIQATRSYSKVESGGSQKNFCQIRYRYKAESASSYGDWATILRPDSLDSDMVDTGALLDGALTVDATWLVQVQAVDDIGESATTTITIPTAKVYMHRTKNAMGLGKYAEGENLLDVAWDACFHGEVYIGDKTLAQYILDLINGGG